MSTEIAKKRAQSKSEQALADTCAERTIRPAYEVIPSDESFEVRVTMPGVGKEGLNLTLEKDNLLIEGIRTSWRQPSWQTIHQEISDANYRLRLQLNVAIIDDNIAAKIEEGVLRVTLPVAEEAKARAIAIE